MTEIAAGKKARIKWEFVTAAGELGTVDGMPVVKCTGNATVLETLYDAGTGLWSTLIQRGDGSSSDVSVTADVDLDTADDHKKYQDFPLASLHWLTAEVTQITGIQVTEE